MAAFKDNALERRNASVAAKQALLQKFRTQPAPDDPSIQQRLAERAAILEAREVRMAERKRAQELEAARQAELKLLEAAEQAAKDADLLRKQAEQTERDEQIRAERKAARDAKYAARKARTGRR